MIFRLGGLIAAPYTAFDANGELRLATIEKQAEFLVRHGVMGAFVCGTTGEGHSLSTDERMKVARRWVEVAGNSLKVIVHVGHNSLPDAVTLAQHAQRIKGSAVAAMAPFFFKPASAEPIVQFMTPIAKACGELPFYYYHIPSMTGVTVPVIDFLELATDRIPNLAGIKFTHSDLMDYQRCAAFEGRKYEIAWGIDEMLLGALAAGAESAVGSTYNYAAPLYTKMIAAFRSGNLDTARALALRSAEMVVILLKHGGQRAGKLAMALVGVDCGPPRSPLVPLTLDEQRAVREAYERLDVLAR